MDLTQWTDLDRAANNVEFGRAHTYDALTGYSNDDFSVYWCQLTKNGELVVEGHSLESYEHAFEKALLQALRDHDRA